MNAEMREPELAGEARTNNQMHVVIVATRKRRKAHIKRLKRRSLGGSRARLNNARVSTTPLTRLTGSARRIWMRSVTMVANYGFDKNFRFS